VPLAKEHPMAIESELKELIVERLFLDLDPSEIEDET
jgi:acyl carrier protein